MPIWGASKCINAGGAFVFLSGASRLFTERGFRRAWIIEILCSKDYIGIMSDPLNQETVNDTAKLIMHRLIARSLVRDPSLVDRAQVSLAAVAARFPDRSFARDWESLLGLPTTKLRSLLTGRDQDMTRLRLSSPLVTAAGVDFTDQALRRRIWRAARRSDRDRRKAAA